MRHAHARAGCQHGKGALSPRGNNHVDGARPSCKGQTKVGLADPEEVFELLEEAWRMTATKRDQDIRQKPPTRPALRSSC
jgi:hypothetical protein